MVHALLPERNTSVGVHLRPLDENFVDVHVSKTSRRNGGIGGNGNGNGNGLGRRLTAGDPSCHPPSVHHPSVTHRAVRALFGR